MSIIHLTSAPKGDNSEIVELLESILEDARKGEIRSLVVGAVDRDGVPSYSCYGRNQLELEGLAARVWKCVADDDDVEDEPSAA